MLPLGVCYLHKTSTALFSIRIRQYRINTVPNLLQKFELSKKKKEKFAFLLFFWENATRKRHFTLVSSLKIMHSCIRVSDTLVTNNIVVFR